MREHLVIETHACGCGTDAWTSPAVDSVGRAVVAVSLHLTPDGTICPRGAFAVDEPAPTPERQRRWCINAMHETLMTAPDVAVGIMALRETLFTDPPAVAFEIAATCFGAAEAVRAARGVWDEHRQRASRRMVDICTALATLVDLTWEDVDPDGKVRARLAIIVAMEAAEEEAGVNSAGGQS